MINKNVIKRKLINWYKLRCPYCGNEMYKPYFYLIVKHLIRNKSYYSCPICHKTTCYISTFRTVTDHTDNKERDLNKKIWDSRLIEQRFYYDK